LIVDGNRDAAQETQVFILDIGLLGMHGHVLARRLRAKTAT
jgi:DNA-binding response OmpR family regulator